LTASWLASGSGDRSEAGFTSREPIRPLSQAERLELERAAELVAAFDEAVAEKRVL
jgi:hypothetical protein